MLLPYSGRGWSTEAAHQGRNWCGQTAGIAVRVVGLLVRVRVRVS